MKPTMEMIEAHARADAQFDGYDFDKLTSGVQTAYLRRSRMCLTAALAAMPAPEVKVKTLEWEQNEGDDWCFTQYTSDTFGGSYCIEERPTGDFDLYIPGAAVSERFSSLAEAKSAAQKDHEARIRAALTPATDLAAENDIIQEAHEETVYQRFNDLFKRGRDAGGFASDTQNLIRELTNAMRDAANWRAETKIALQLERKMRTDLAAENERLRAALEKIADTDPDDGTIWFHNVANIALERKP